jgi:hypothetical protein
MLLSVPPMEPNKLFSVPKTNIFLKQQMRQVLIFHILAVLVPALPVLEN